MWYRCNAFRESFHIWYKHLFLLRFLFGNQRSKVKVTVASQSMSIQFHSKQLNLSSEGNSNYVCLEHDILWSAWGNILKCSHGCFQYIYRWAHSGILGTFPPPLRGCWTPIVFLPPEPQPVASFFCHRQSPDIQHPLGRPCLFQPASRHSAASSEYLRCFLS